MKFALVFAAVLGLAVAAPKAQPRDLIEDIRRFLALIPQDETKALFESQYSSDAAFASSVDFIRSPRFGELVGIVDGVAEFKAYFDYLESENIPAYFWLNAIRTWLGVPEFPAMDHTTKLGFVASKQSRSILPFIEAFLGLLTHSEWTAVHEDLVANSPDYVHLWSVYQSAEYAAVRSALTEHPTYVEATDELDSNGVLLTEAIDLIRAWLRQ